MNNIKLARLGTRQYNYTQNALNQLASITQPGNTPSAANYGLSSCADASMTADLSSSYTGPTIAMPAAGTAGTATTGGTQVAKYTFTHDNEGRMTAKGTQAYVYDALNRMTQVTGKESYLYDGHGRRVQVTKTSDSKKNYPLYGLDGKLLLEDNRQTLKRTEYIYANGRLIAKRIQPITAAGANNGTATVTTIHTDFLGSPVAETNSAGTVTRIERYTPYGEPADLQLDVGPGFTGHATDVATGLTYMQQRYYDADIGRFISPDPVGPEEDFIKHFNRYNYALNNPVRYTDPDGRYSCTKEICPLVREVVTAMRTARNSFSRNSDEYRTLTRLLKALGSENDKSGPNIVAGALSDERAASYDQSNTITIDFKKMNENYNPNYSGGRSLTHETKHYADTTKNGVANTVDAVRARETDATDAEKAFMKAYGETMTDEKRTESIEKSVRNWLERQKNE